MKPLLTTPHDKLTRVEIPVAGLDCKACSFGAYLIVSRIDGVHQATASFHDGKISALIDPANTNLARIASALSHQYIKVLTTQPSDTTQPSP